MTNLISGKEALIALANGEEVETKKKDETTWSAIDFFAVNVFKNDKWEFRLKLRTLTINGINVPAPFEPKEGDVVWVISDYRNGYREFQYNKSIYNAFGAWRTEDEVKQVVEALRQVFGKEMKDD